MGLKKLVYILFIFLISILHTVTLTTWLSKDSGLIESNNGANLNNSTDSVVTAKTSTLIITPELNQLYK